MAFSFPYPQLGSTVRAVGQGCRVCVHQTYCQALYWFRRGGDSRGFRVEPVDDDHMGIACASWSTDPAARVTVVTQTDEDWQEYVYRQGTGSEANRNGMAAVTGSGRRP